MEVQRNKFTTPIGAKLTMMDLHIGVLLSAADRSKQVVALFMQPSDALITENKSGTVLASWGDVLQILEGLVEAANEAWGPFGESPEAKALAKMLKPEPEANRPEREVIAQIIYALQRQARALDAQAAELGAAHDYSAEFPAEDADRMREAIAIMQVLLEKNGYEKVSS